jgi:hypothetical protein
MNDVSNNKKKDSILKSLAITGFIGIIILIAWVSVKIVGMVPDAFSSLASLAEVLNRDQDSAITAETDQIELTNSTFIVNVDEPIELAWKPSETEGSYTFSYVCEEGVAVDMVKEDGVQSIACDTNYNVGEVDSLTLNVDSEKERFAELNYTISFFGKNDMEPRALTTSSVSIINSGISADSELSDLLAQEEEEVEEEVAPAEEPKPVVEETPVTSDTPAATPSTGPSYEYSYEYTIPASDPNGQTDLATKFLDLGTIVGNTFFSGNIKREHNGAIQFEVKNIGTKTSDDWSFSVNLPTGGTYTAEDQEPLKPNERAVLTIGFPTTDKASYTFLVEVDESDDINSVNDNFTKTATFF